MECTDSNTYSEISWSRSGAATTARSFFSMTACLLTLEWQSAGRLPMKQRRVDSGAVDWRCVEARPDPQKIPLWSACAFSRLPPTGLVAVTNVAPQSDVFRREYYTISMSLGVSTVLHTALITLVLFPTLSSREIIAEDVLTSFCRYSGSSKSDGYCGWWICGIAAPSIHDVRTFFTSTLASDELRHGPSRVARRTQGSSSDGAHGQIMHDAAGSLRPVAASRIVPIPSTAEAIRGPVVLQSSNSSRSTTMDRS